VGGASALTENNKSELSQLASRLAGSTDRLQLKAYASAEGGTASAARRLSLSRALTVRSQLIAKGIRSTRIDVRALGIAESGEPDRVDVLLLKRP
jgi:outer membrane protein OmpA-like peptidoglycan-associated protein